ncbi:MAG: VWA domain-containing protein [Lachnospiraceae bacterium]|nr:VWA domain-containing protein [Lachnospiraceae bacterium]
MYKQQTMDDFFHGRMNAVNEPHLACVLLLDTSASMGIGKCAINDLNEGIRRFKDSVCSDPVAVKRVDIALVTFNSEVEVLCPFVPISDMPLLQLTASGTTSMAEGINTAIDLVKQRVREYQMLGTPCHKPWIFMITDGKSTSDYYEFEKAAKRVRDEENIGKDQNKPGRLSFWVLGIDNYRQSEMVKITDRVLELRDHDFKGIFDWLSESMSCISQSHVGEKVEFDDLPKNARKAQKDRAIDEEWY